MKRVLSFLVLPICTGLGCGANADPEAVVHSHSDGEEILEAYTESFQGTVSDPDNPLSELRATWYVAGLVACAATVPDEAGNTECVVLVTETTTQVRLEVTDSEEAVGFHDITLVVLPTKSPVAKILSPTGAGTYYSDEEIPFEGQASDAEDVPADLDVAWGSDLDGTLSVADEPDDEGLVSGVAYLSEGEHVLSMTVVDLTGKTGTDQRTIVVEP